MGQELNNVGQCDFDFVIDGMRSGPRHGADDGGNSLLILWVSSCTRTRSRAISRFKAISVIESSCSRPSDLRSLSEHPGLTDGASADSSE